MASFQQVRIYTGIGEFPGNFNEFFDYTDEYIDVVMGSSNSRPRSASLEDDIREANEL